MEVDCLDRARQETDVERKPKVGSKDFEAGPSQQLATIVLVEYVLM
jgi:hypothetical protein